MFRVVGFLTLFLAISAFAKEPRQTHEEGAQFVGAIGCRSSSCHGGAGDKRSQYITWSQKDFHNKAFVILTDARSARIAEAVGGGEVSANARCTVCHSPLQSVSQTRLATTARPDEGVSCETCHGAAGPWLRGHTRSDWTYAMRISAGMHDLKSLYVRANTCVACHQNIDNDLLKAGHPPLVFELDSQSVNEPKHWHDDDPWTGVRSWLVGQAVALREVTWAIAQRPVQDDDEFARWHALKWILSKVPLANENNASLPAMSAFPGIQLEADKIARHAVQLSCTLQSVRELLVTLASTENDFVGKTGDKALPENAKRLVLAFDTLGRALNANGGAPLKVDNELSALREDVKIPDHFDAAHFADHLRAFRSKL